MQTLTINVELEKTAEKGVWMTPQRESNCQGCAASMSCSKTTKLSSVSTSFITNIQTDEKLAEDMAALSIAQNKLSLACLLIYGLPLIFMLLGAILSLPLKHDGLSLMCILLGMGLGYLCAKYGHPYLIHNEDLTLKVSTNNTNFYKE